MDGGIDALYLKRFGPELQDRVRKAIAEHHGGELLVGAAEIVPTLVNPYLAARAVLRLVRGGTFPPGALAGTPIREKVRRVAFPGLGTGVGQISANVCAHQLAQAIDDVLLDHDSAPRTWAEASDRHQDLTGGRRRRLQSEAN